MASELTVQEQINQSISVFGNNEFPATVQKGVNEIMKIVHTGKTLPDLYEKELKEVMVSTSIFQDICVQMEEHFTPHRKMRQVLLELDGKLSALDGAKNSHKKSIVKCQTLENEVNELQDLYNELDKDNVIIDFNLALRLSNITYTVKNGMDSFQSTPILNSNLVQVSINQTIDDPKFVKSIQDKVKVALGNKIVDYDESKRAIKNSQHIIKDAAVKAHQLRVQAEKYKKLCAESGMSFDESEFIYYVMFFTAEVERQFRTGDHQIDRGTYKAISQLPDFIRQKVLKNISYIYDKLQNMNSSDDYIFKTDEEFLKPEMIRDKDGTLIVEGFKVFDFLMVDVIRTMKNEDD